jgi:hypothetical protein
MGICSNSAWQRVTEDDFDGLSKFVLEKYRGDGIRLVKKCYEQKHVRSWDWSCIDATMKGFRVLNNLDEELATFLVDSLLEQWKHAHRYWEIHHSLMFFSNSVVCSSIWYGRELDIIQALAYSFLRIEKAESCNMFYRLYVLVLFTHLPS